MTGLTRNAALRSATVAIVVTAALALLVAPQALAAFGDDFGLADAPNPTYPGPSALFAGTCDLAAGDADVGTAPALPRDCVDYGTPNTDGTSPDVWSTPPSWRLRAVTQAGAHPDATTAFWFKRTNDPSLITSPNTTFPEGQVRDTVFDLPPGLVADPTAVPQCSAETFAVFERCPAETQVGIATLRLMTFNLRTEIHPVYNMEPRRGKAAELMIADAGGTTPIPVTADVRTDGDFGVTALSVALPSGLPTLGVQITLWGVPWDASHDVWRLKETSTVGVSGTGRMNMPPVGLNAADQAHYDGGWGPIKPFWSNPTECDGQSPVTALTTDSWSKIGRWTAAGAPDLSDPAWRRYEAPAPPVTGCAKPPFDPATQLDATSTQPDSAAGIGVDIDIPANDEPPASVATNPDGATGAPAHWRSDAGLATSQLDRTVVTLPEGLSVNPSGATGLEACSDAQVGVTAVGNPYRFDKDDPFDGKGQDCPDGSTIGTVVARTPVLDEPLTGEVVLGAPRSTDPQSGEMFRLFLVLRNENRGLVAKVFGSAVADPATGQLTATFDKNPRVPVERIRVDLKGGQRSVLATPAECGEKTGIATFTPWTAAWNAGGVAKTVTPSLTVAGDCSNPFALALAAGMSTQQARGNGTFAFRFARNDGTQYFKSLTATLPEGLLASVRGVPLCRGAQAATGDCPAGSQIGMVDASAGSGTPFVLERKGDVYLTEGYKGCAYGLVVVVPVVAGPFDGSSPATDLGEIVVRQAVCVDPSDAHVTAVSDPFPTIWHGIPLRVRSVTVKVDRPGFMLNPSDCSAKQIGGAFRSARGATAAASTRFQATDCAALPFKPKLALRLIGRRQVRTGTHPRIKAIVTQQGVGEAGIERAEVRLPKSLALDPDNAQALCEFEDGTKPDLENHCPKGSIVGRARAKSPLLERDLAGNVYFVKNVRRSARGNLVRTLPMIVVALRGEIAVNLRGESNVKRGRLVNTFAAVPDAPITQFNLNIKGGKNGILVVTRTARGKINVCRGRQVAEVDMDGQNGRRHDFDVRVKTPPCTRKKAARQRRG